MSEAKPHSAPAANAAYTIAGNIRGIGAAAELRSTATIRTRAKALLERARRGESAWFTVNDGAMATAAALAVAIPAVFGYNICANRVNRLDSELEGFGSELIALMVREGRI